MPVLDYASANVFFRAMRRLAGQRSMSWLFARVLPRIDRFVSRVTGRRVTLAGLVTGLQVLLLTTTGARTGTQWTTTPVLYLREADDFVLIAGNWGARTQPVLVLQPAGQPEGTGDAPGIDA